MPGRTKALKSVKFGYTPTVLSHELLVTFRNMVNRAIGICLDENVHSRLALRDRIYGQFKGEFGVVSCFPYSVAEVAWSIVKKHRRWKRRPFAKRLMMKMDAQDYSLNFSLLSLPYKKGTRAIIQLSYGDYQRAFLADTTLRKGSVTLTESEVIIAFSKEITPVEPIARIGVDLNEKSVVRSDGTRSDLSEVLRLHTEYGLRRNAFSEKHSDDNRLKKKFSRSSREKDRIRQFLHREAKAIVEAAKEKNQAIVLERLTGVRHAHARNNDESPAKRRRISNWPFRTLQFFIVYKARWEGVPFEFVNPAWTSKTCHWCNRINKELKPTQREWLCPSCGATLDRDLNAAINIERRGKIACLGEVRPGAQGTDEAVKGNPTTPVILQAEALKSMGPTSA